ncbi:MAG: hypothetical protein U0930_05295 [Pirellulales bacterium]
MKNCLRKWFRHLLLISITSVGVAAASPANAHDLPIFDSIGLYNCFGLSSPNWQLDPNLSSIANQVTSAAQADWTNSGWSWCFADTPNLDTIQTEPRQEFSYLGPATSQASPQVEIPFSQFSDSFAPVRTDIATSSDDVASDDYEGCENDVEFDCFPAKRIVTEPSQFAYDDVGCPADIEGSDVRNSDESIASENDFMADDVYLSDEEMTDDDELSSESSLNAPNDTVEAETLVNEDYVEIVPDLPEQEIPSFSNMLDAGYSMLPKFSLTDSYSGLRSWVLANVKPTVLAAEPDAFDSSTVSQFAGNSNNSANYLSSRPLIDDYLGGESFVRDWRNLQLFRNPTPTEPAGFIGEYGWNAPLHDEIAQSEPTKYSNDNLLELWKGLASAIETIECYCAQETYSFSHTHAAGWNLGQAISSIQRQPSEQVAKFSRQLEKLQQNQFVDLEMLGQPLFVIHRLDGKEFLLPAKQAKQWNTVPQISAATTIDWRAIAAKSAAFGNISKIHPKRSGNFVEASEAQAGLSLSQISKNLVRSTSVGLDGLADRLHSWANSLRLTVDIGTQVADLTEGDSVR